MTQNTVASGALQAPYGQKETQLSEKQVLVSAVHYYQWNRPDGIPK